MTRLLVRSRILVAISALLLLPVFMVPLWRIQLHAPQYPEGLGMLIRVNTITGIKPPDLDNINGLNHYIGMKAIDPAEFPVLRVMPWAVGGLALLALVTAASGLRVLLFGWLAAFAVAGAAGLADFYRWAYDYGHNLAPDAIIKVPGMSYQPPLIGSKQLLNFTADSWPAAGSWFAVGAFALGAIALLPFTRRGRDVLQGAPARRAGALAVLVLVAAMGCHAGDPRPMEYGRADCDVCRMRITDNRFGGQVVTRTGKVHQFDSIECLAEFSVGAGAIVRSAWVNDFERPGTLIPVATALFVRRAGPSAGMGANLVAVSPSAGARSWFGVAPMDWLALRELAARRALHVPDSLRSVRGA